MDIATNVKTEKIDNMGEDEVVVADVPTNAGSNKRRRPRGTRRAKIRRLAEKPIAKNDAAIMCKSFLIVTVIICSTVAVLIGHYMTQNNTNTQHIIRDFLKNYRNQYRQIIHGKQDYCDQNQQLDTQKIFDRVKQYDILNQEKALQEIEMALRNDSDFNSISLVGPVGVGKSLFMRAMIENFPWQENVHTYSWTTYVEEEAKRFHLVRILIENLSECGQNLIVIENLKPCDRLIVEFVNGLIRESIAEQQKRVTIFYLFSLNTMLPKEKYEKDKKLVLALTDTSVINFASFGENELKACIRREMDLEGLTLTEEDFDEIVATIDPFKSGCKNVHAKVIMYGSSSYYDNL